MKKSSLILLLSLSITFLIMPLNHASSNENSWFLSNAKREFFYSFVQTFKGSFTGSYYSNYSNKKTIFVYIVGDGLTEDQAEIIWGKSVEDINKITIEKGVVYEYKVLNENPALLISAVDADTLTGAIKNDSQLQELVTRIMNSQSVTPYKELKIPHIDLKIYSPSRDAYNQIMSNLRTGEVGVSGGGSRPYGYQNDKGVFVHLIGDDLGDVQTEIIWGKKLSELDKETQEKGVTFTLSTLNENKVLLLSAVSLDMLINEMKNNNELKQAIIQIKRAKVITPKNLIKIPAPEEKIRIETKKEQVKLTSNIDRIKLVMDQKPLELDVPPQIIKGRTLVPLRGIFEKFGAEVNWEAKSQVIKAKKESTNVELTIGKMTALLNGSEKSLDVPAQVISGRTLVPLRFISESMGLKVNWDKGKQTVEITSIN